MVKKDELKIGNFVLYESEAKIGEDGNPIISMNIEEIVNLNDSTFDSKDKKELKIYRISKVSQNGKFDDYEGYVQDKIYDEIIQQTKTNDIQGV